MKRAQCILAVVVVLGCLAVIVTDLEAVKPPKPTPTPAPSPTPCTTCTVAYVQVKNQAQSIRLMEEDGSNESELISWNGVVIKEPTWSPDGGWIAFNALDTTTDHQGLYVIRNDGAELTEITPRCNFEPASNVRNRGPSWQPEDVDGNGMHWVVYSDNLPEDCGTPGVYNLLAVEVGLGSPVTVGRRVVLTDTDEGAWGTPVWSGDGHHLAVRRSPLTLRNEGSEILVFDVSFTADGLPYLANPWSITPPELVGYVQEPAWAHWSDSLVAIVVVAGSGIPRKIWQCDVDFSAGTYVWANLTPDAQDAFMGPRFSSDDRHIVASIQFPYPPGGDGIWVAALDPVSGVVVKSVRTNMSVVAPDWRP